MGCFEDICDGLVGSNAYVKKAKQMIHSVCLTKDMGEPESAYSLACL